MINRPVYLKKLIDRKQNGLVKIITGVRRCGKSVLLFDLYFRHLVSEGVLDRQIVRIQLDNSEFAALRNPLKLSEYIKSRITDDQDYFIFIDEIQLVKKIRNKDVEDDYITFLDVLNGFVSRRNLDIYVTGSNSKMLSKDVLTEFRGRGDEVRVYPLSFREFCSAREDSKENALKDYMLYGGMPFILSRPSPESKISYLHPDEGYVLNGMAVWWVDENNNQQYVEISGGTWYNNEAKFVMPLADVYYTAYFAPRVYMDYEVNIPKTGDISVNIPEGVTRLTVYDDNSGYYGAYSNNSDGMLTLTAPEGYSLYVNGSVQTPEEADSLVICDGADVSAPKLLKIFGNDDVSDIYSSGQSLTFRFKSNAEWNSYGLELYVTVLKTTRFGAVAVHEAFGGKLARIDGGYTGSDAVDISESIDVDWIEISRDFTSGNPATVVLPFALPEGTEINADFYALTAVVQNGNRWKATLTYIGDNVLPQANTPYAIIVPPEISTIC